LSEKVDELLEGVFEGGHSNVRLGLGSSHYVATGKRLCPLQLTEGLHLAGGIDKLKVSTPTFQALLTGSPPIDVEIEGVRILISADDKATDLRAQAASSSARKIAKKKADDTKRDVDVKHLSVDVKNVVVELKCGGHVIVARLASLKATPAKDIGRKAAKWNVAHGPLRLELDDQNIATLTAANANYQLAEKFRRADLDLHTMLSVCLDVDQLLAILDVAAAAEAMACIGAGTEQSGATEKTRDHIAPFAVMFQSANLKLDMLGCPLLQAGCKMGNISVSPSLHQISIASLEVTRAGSETVESDELVIQRTDSQPDALLIHGFPEQAGQSAVLPWRGTLELLLDDPRFAPHRAWLEGVRDNVGVQLTTKKRKLEDIGRGSDSQKRSRM